MTERPGTVAVTAATSRSGPTSDTPSPVAAPTTPAADVAALASATSPGGGGPPIAGLVALALIGGLGVAGWFTLRRRDAQGR